MTTVFLSGSRKLGRIGEEIRQRLTKMVDNQLNIIVGDANGADRAMQAYLADLNYGNVTVYFVGDMPRNNVGHWPTSKVPSDVRAYTRDFYAQKDRQMSKVADYGFVLWDGKSVGSVQNMLWLLQEGKKLVVYFAPEKTFHNFADQEEFVKFLLRIDRLTLDEIAQKISFPENIKKGLKRQVSLDF